MDARELLVVAPLLVGVGLHELGELGRLVGVGALEDREPRLAPHELLDRDGRLDRVEPEGHPVLVGDHWLIDLLMSMPWAMQVE